MYVHCTDIARIPLMLVAQRTVHVRFVNFSPGPILAHGALNPQVCETWLHVMQHLVKVRPSRAFVSVLAVLKASTQHARVGSMVRTTLVSTPIIVLLRR